MAASRRPYGETRSALLGRPGRVTGSRKSGSRPMEGGPWWLQWTERGMSLARSRLALGPQEHRRRCLGSGPVRLLRVLVTSPAWGVGAVWDEAVDGLRRDGAPSARRMRGVAADVQGHHLKEHCN